MTTQVSLSSLSNGGRLASTEGKTLPLVSAALDVDAKGGLARVRFRQRFANQHAEPLTVTYKLPLPADAAVGGYLFEVGPRKIRGRVEKKAVAREQFEAALAEGKSAALLEEERSSLFTQEIGNIPPRTEVSVEITLDVPLAWIERGAWELRFPLAAAPRYLGGQAESLANVVVDVASGRVAARASLSLAIRDALVRGKSPESPSHPLQCKETPDGYRVELGSDNQVELDRDVVVRWPVALPSPSASIDVARPDSPGLTSAYGLLAIVPPAFGQHAATVKRDVTLLIDTSGSMHGSPLEQAKRISAAIVDSLGDDDTLELIEFGNTARPYKSKPARATRPEKKAALEWISRLFASGGTEMLSGVRAALAPLRPESQRQVVLITDGLIGFERDIVAELLARLPSSCRFHAIGVGAAANRSLLMPVARAGRGIEAIVGIGEDAEPAAQRVLARMRDPMVVDVSVSGSALVSFAPKRLPDLFGGSPARIAVELRPEGGELQVSGRTAEGPYRAVLQIAPVERGAGNDAVPRLFARERVEDLETDLVAGGDRATLEGAIERTGLDHAISTRLTSFVAITDDPTVDPRDATRRETMPQALPFGVSAEGLGLRAAMPMQSAFSSATAYPSAAFAPQSFAAPSGSPGFGAPRAPSAFGAPPPAALGGAPPPPPARREAEPLRARMATPAAPPPAPSAAAAKPAARAAIVAPRAEKKEAAAEASRAPTPLTATPSAVGHIVLKQGTRVVVEVEVPHDGFDFPVGELLAVLRTHGGDQVIGKIDAAKTTRAGTYSAGVTLRVVIELDRAIATDIDVATLMWGSALLVRAE